MIAGPTEPCRTPLMLGLPTQFARGVVSWFRLRRAAPDQLVTLEQLVWVTALAPEARDEAEEAAVWEQAQRAIAERTANTPSSRP